MVDTSPQLEWAVATRALPGETESGDRSLVQPFPGGTLLAVVDGLGHGVDAAAAATKAVATLAAHAQDPIVDLVQRCHEALRATRGVVLTLALLHEAGGAMTWVGVGDVEGLLLRADVYAVPRKEYLMLRGGVVGYQLPPLRTSQLTVQRGDLLIFATDGIRGGFTDGLDATGPAQQIADRILAQHSRGTDDALVLVARYGGQTP